MESVLSVRKLYGQLKRLFWVWLALAVLAGIAVLAGRYFSQPRHNLATAVISFSYEGIESGNNPIGGRLDLAEIKNETVLRAAAEEAGLSLDDEALEQIQSAILITGNVPSSVLKAATSYHSIYDTDEKSEEKTPSTTGVQEKTYFPSTYTLSLDYGAVGLSGEQAGALLQALYNQYEAYFYRLYGYNPTVEQSIRALDYSSYDYDKAVAALDANLKLLQNYLTRLSNEDNTHFVSSETGYSFADLVNAVQTMRSEDLDRISSYINTNAMSKYPDEQLASYLYQLDNLESDRTSQQETVAVLDELISGYNKTKAVLVRFGSSDVDTTSLVEVVQQSDAYNELITERINANVALSETAEQIAKYSTLAERLRTYGNRGDNALVEERLNAVDQKTMQMVELAGQTAKEYYGKGKLRNSLQLVSASSGAGTSLLSLLRGSVRSGFLAESFLFGAWLLAALILALLPSGTKAAAADLPISGAQNKQKAKKKSR